MKKSNKINPSTLLWELCRLFNFIAILYDSYMVFRYYTDRLDPNLVKINLGMIACSIIYQLYPKVSKYYLIFAPMLVLAQMLTHFFIFSIINFVNATDPEVAEFWYAAIINVSMPPGLNAVSFLAMDYLYSNQASVSKKESLKVEEVDSTDSKILEIEYCESKNEPKDERLMI